MSRNREILEILFSESRIDLRRGTLFDAAPGPMPGRVEWDRVEGMLLGLAIGDALGNTTEGQLPAARAAGHGEIRDYLPNRYAGGRRVGVPSDDSQLAFWMLEQMLTDGGLDPEHVAARLCSGQIFGIGSAVREFTDNHKAGRPWWSCGIKSAGNGALMRIAPILLPHLRTGTSDLWADAALAAMITHNDSASNAACVSFVHMLWKLLQTDAPPRPDWWADAYVEVARGLETDEGYAPLGGEFLGQYQGPLWRYTEERVRQASQRGLVVLDACNEWHSGAYLLETMPCVVYILMRHGHEPEEAIVRAVNDTKDNDTVAAIVGAAVGALHGKAGLPSRWVSGLLGRTGASDDGRVFELIAEGRRLWWDSLSVLASPHV